MRPTISMSYGKGRSHGDSAKSLILYGNIGSDRKIPAVVLVLQPGPFGNTNRIKVLTEMAGRESFCYLIDFVGEFRLGSRSPGCSIRGRPIEFYRNCPGSPFAGVNSTCTGRKTMDFQHLNGALAYHYRAKRAYFGQYRDGFSIFACN